MKPAFAALASIILSITSCSPHDKFSLPDSNSEASDFSFVSEVQTENTSVTRVMATLSSGPVENTYTASIVLDGKKTVVQERTVSFRNEPFLVISIPGIRPGNHTLKITLSMNGRSLSAEHPFSEPLRDPVFDVYITPEGGKTFVSFGENPYEVEMSLTDTLSVTGTCTYTVCVNNGVTSEESKTMTLTERTQITRFLPQEDIKYELCDSQSLEDIITGMGEMNWGWRVEWDNLGGGRFLYYPQTQGISYYWISAESISVDATVDGFSGLTVNVHNSYPNLYWNGTQVTETVYSYKLP